MEENNFIMVNLEDERASKLAGVLSNKTCKKILNYLAENKEKSEEDISKDLRMPINTAEYNLKKLLASGLIEKSKKFFWSKKGKKINLYKVAKKHIIISPKSSRVTSKLKSILPVTVISGVLGITLRYLIIFKQNADQAKPDGILRETQIFAQSASQKITSDSGTILSAQTSPIWIWFLAGALIAIVLFTLLNWRKL